ncbi:DUF2188 domain-containing protein [Novosphingobium sp.]|uniref:DUF2188 domain-containing protein n=1 Tax=Novosphingobium sp. TaxID=1874826 RepID=UPI00286D89A4|nr:DUF2188 domain-containing protein [Novosphingobium sp.]
MSLLSQISNRLRAVHVTWHFLPGEWQVKEAGSSTVLYRSTSKPPAITYGRSYAIAIKGELIVHNMDGTIAERDSHGHDPFPPRG